MKVLIIPTWYPSGEDKLMGNYHKEFTRALNTYGIDSDMLYVERERLSTPLDFIKMKKYEKISEDGYDVYIKRILNIEPISFDLSIKKYVKSLDKAFKMYLKNNDKPDVLHAMCTLPAGYAACLLGQKYDIPVVVSEHGGLLERFFENDKLKKYGFYVLDNSTYTVVSSYMKDIVSKYKKECFILPNQINTETFKNDVNRKIDGTFNLVMCCAIRQGKRLDMAFKALKKLIDDGMDVHLDIIGDGFYGSIYKDACINEGVSGYTTFLGIKDKKEISKIFESEHALLISSEIESFAIPAIEAMASGMPVISTDCGGPADFIDAKTGVLVKVNDADSIKDGIMKVYKNYDKYKKEDLINRANEYSEYQVVELAKKIYNKALKNSK